MWENKKQIESFWKNYTEFQGENVADEVLRLSKKYIHGKVLDVGAGTGALIKKIPDSVGIDLVERPGINKASITDLPFDNSSFDTIFAMEVLEHLGDKDLKKGLDEVSRVLKKKGYFIVTVPNNENLEDRMINCPFCGKRFHRVQHMRSFNNLTIKSILESHGFKVIVIKQEPYDFNKKIGTFVIKYKHVRFLKLLLNLVKKGNLFIVARKI